MQLSRRRVNQASQSAPSDSNHGGSTIMLRFAFAALAIMSLATESFAGPFGPFKRGSSNNYSNQNTNNSGGTVYYDNGELYSAQGVANRMARLLRMAHLGNPTGGYEGVGMGGSPQAAIQNCCYYGRRPLRDSGVAQGANGMWYACCRYN